MLLALAIGTVCGIGASRASMPLPWMLGPMLGCAIAAFAKAPIRNPRALRPIVMPVIGVMLGSGFHPGIQEYLSAWTSTLLLLPVYLALAGSASFLVFRKLGNFDGATAFYSAMPGGLNEMTLMGAAAGGDETRIALSHAIRIFVVIAAVAIVFALVFHVRSANSGSTWIRFADVPLFDLAILLVCAVAGVWIAHRIKLQAPGLFGPMLLSAALHVTGIVTMPPPTILIIVAQVVIGTVLGCRFLGADLRQTGRDMSISIVATLAMLAVTLPFALLVPLTGSAPTSQAILAFSPGGLAEMSLLAIAIHQDVAYVATMHVARIFLVVSLVPLVARLLGPRIFGPKL